MELPEVYLGGMELPGMELPTRHTKQNTGHRYLRGTELPGVYRCGMELPGMELPTDKKHKKNRQDIDTSVA